NVFRDRLRNLATPDRPATPVAGAFTLAAMALVYWHDGDDTALALAWPRRPMAPCRQLQLRQPDNRQLGPACYRIARRGSVIAHFTLIVRAQLGGLTFQLLAGSDFSNVRACRPPAATRSRSAQRIWTLERIGACEHAARLWLSDCTICRCSVTE